MSLAEKVALIAGGSRGIGRAIALELASRGVNLIVNYFCHGKAAREAVIKIENHKVRIMSVLANEGKRNDMNALFEEATTSFGGIDIQVCNAAFGVFPPALEIELQAWA